MADDNVTPFPPPAKIPARFKSRSPAANRAWRYRQRKRHALVPSERHAPPSTNADVAPVSFDSVTPHSVTVMAPERHASTSRPPGRKMGAVLIILALAIAGLAIGINAQVGWHFGTTPLAATTFAGLSIAADALAIVLPSTALALWWNRRHLLASAAWATWTVVVTMAILASLGFASLHLGDTAAARSAIVSTAVATADQRNATIEAARAAADAATKSRIAECGRRGPLCRDLEHVEQTRMGELAAAIALPIPTAAAIADADPQVAGAVRLAQWVGLGVTATDVGNLRLALMALLPNLAGLVLCFGVALRR
jgi:hypothetical protein